MTVTFEKPKTSAAPKKKAGGDDDVLRDGHGRPKIIIHCGECEGTGKVPSQKVEGRLNKCPKCGPRSSDPDTAVLPMGKRFKAYTRVTTYIDVLEDKGNLMDWGKRMVLRGAALDPTFLDGVLDLNPEDKDGRTELSRRAEACAILAGSEEKSTKGTERHDLSEMVDRGESLPTGITDGEARDMFAYWEGTRNFNIVRMEQLVVNDRFLVAGTPDRVSSVVEPVEAPDGTIITPDELLITDLKTGRVDYGRLKMAMQLSIYANAKLYDKGSGDRLDPGPINKQWGIIMHLPIDSGELTLYWADLELGYRAVSVAEQVREMRSVGSKALVRIESGS